MKETVVYDERMKTSLYNPQCRDCFMRFTDPLEEDTGCRGLTIVPKNKCSFHKTREEQDVSLEYARRRNGEIIATRQRIRDLRIF